MPPWLVEALSQLSPEGSITSFVGTIATFVALVIVRVMQERKKLDRAMQSVPPTVRAVPDQPTVIATARRIWELEQEIADMRERLSRVDADRKAVSADAVRLGGALAESERRNEALSVELATLRREIEGGHTRLPMRRSSVTLRPIGVTEIDDRPTPREGTRRPR